MGCSINLYDTYPLDERYTLYVMIDKISLSMKLPHTSKSLFKSTKSLNLLSTPCYTSSQFSITV